MDEKIILKIIKETIEDMYEGGKWITLNANKEGGKKGTKLFIKNGQSVKEAIAELATKGKQGKKEGEIPKMQMMLSNESWVDSTVSIESLLKRNKITKSELIDRLKNKKPIYYGSDWYADIRMKPTKTQKEAKKQKILKAQEESLKYQKEEKKKQSERVGKYDKW